MTGKNNHYEIERKMAPSKQRFGIKKLTIGTASVLLGAIFMLGGTHSVSADQTAASSSSQPEVAQKAESSSSAASKVALNSKTKATVTADKESASSTAESVSTDKKAAASSNNENSTNNSVAQSSSSVKESSESVSSSAQSTPANTQESKKAAPVNENNGQQESRQSSTASQPANNSAAQSGQEKAETQPAPASQQDSQADDQDIAKPVDKKPADKYGYGYVQYVFRDGEIREADGTPKTLYETPFYYGKIGAKVNYDYRTDLNRFLQMKNAAGENIYLTYYDSIPDPEKTITSGNINYILLKHNVIRETKTNRSTRTINYLDEKGNKLAESVVQHADIPFFRYRDAYDNQYVSYNGKFIDQKNGQRVIDNSWHQDHINSGLGYVAGKSFEHYYIKDTDKTGGGEYTVEPDGSVGFEAINNDTTDSVVNIHYAKMATAKFIYADRDAHNAVLAESNTVYGKPGDFVTYDYSREIGTLLSKKNQDGAALYKLVSVPNTIKYDKQANTFTILFRHNVVPEYQNHTVTRIVNYVDDKGKQLVDPVTSTAKFKGVRYRDAVSGSLVKVDADQNIVLDENGNPVAGKDYDYGTKTIQFDFLLPPLVDHYHVTGVTHTGNPSYDADADGLFLPVNIAPTESDAEFTVHYAPNPTSYINKKTIEASQTVRFVDEKGNELKPADVERFDFVYSGDLVDKLTGELMQKGSWNAVSHTFGTVNAPVIKGYIATAKNAVGKMVTQTNTKAEAEIVYKKLGSIVAVDKQGNKIGTAVVYANDSADPTAIAKEQALPEIKGYQLVTPNNAGVDVAKKVVNPADPTKDTEVIYDNTEKALVNFVDKDADNKVVLTSGTLTGPSGSQISYDYAQALKSLTDKGYVLVSSDFPAGAAFDQDMGKDQVFTVVLAHGVAPLGPDNPQKPETPINPDDPSSPQWPAKDNYERTYTATVHFVDENGKQLSPDNVQTSQWTRTIHVDKVTGRILDPETPWTANIDEYQAVSAPQVKGYTAKTSEVGALKAVQQNLDNTIVYSKNADDKPDKPTNPDNKPDKPTNPDKPSVPDKPTNPDTPAKPDVNPAVPDSNQSQDKPAVDNDNKPNVPANNAKPAADNSLPHAQRTRNAEPANSSKSHKLTANNAAPHAARTKNAEFANKSGKQAGQVKTAAIAKEADKSQTKASVANASKLPQTGDQEEQNTGLGLVAALISMAMFGLTAIGIRRKRHE